MGLRQSDVATLAAVSREQVVRLEAGVCIPKIDTAARLASVLRCELGAIFPTTSEAAGANRGSAKAVQAADDERV